MVSIEILILSALFLFLSHWGARVGLPRRSFSSSESFVLGHWLFLFLNLVILHVTRGYDWTSLDVYSPSTLTVSLLVVGLGLLCFQAGGLFALLLKGLGALKVLDLEAESASTARVGALLTLIGLGAAIPNAVAMGLEGPESRSTILLGLGELLAPGVLLCYLAAKDRALRLMPRMLGALLFGLGVVTLSFSWSRRPIVVVLIGVLVLGFVRRRGFFDRRLIMVVGPILSLLAVLGLWWRNAFVYGQQIASLGDLARFYGDTLWLESSAFSALMLVVETNGLLHISGGGSLLLPLIFWVPRALFPGKPAAFDPGLSLGTPYSIGPSIYGEALVNVTIWGLIPFMAIIGAGLKWLDLSATERRLGGAGAALFVLLILDTLFLVRGSFHTMFTPILLHFGVPLCLLALDRRISRGLRRAESLGRRGAR